jgi:hypothetical protein
MLKDVKNHFKSINLNELSRTKENARNDGKNARVSMDWPSSQPGRPRHREHNRHGPIQLGMHKRMRSHLPSVPQPNHGHIWHNRLDHLPERDLAHRTESAT